MLDFLWILVFLPFLQLYIQVLISLNQKTYNITLFNSTLPNFNCQHCRDISALPFVSSNNFQVKTQPYSNQAPKALENASVTAHRCCTFGPPLWGNLLWRRRRRFVAILIILYLLFLGCGCQQQVCPPPWVFHWILWSVWKWFWEVGNVWIQTPTVLATTLPSAIASDPDPVYLLAAVATVRFLEVILVFWIKKFGNVRI
jgi:hypothetical protein